MMHGQKNIKSLFQFCEFT